MNTNPWVPVSSEDSLVDISTASTTPDGSLTFSPVLQATRLHDALEDACTTETTKKMSHTSVSEGLQPSMKIKNICCVGAGYVGMAQNEGERCMPLIVCRRSNSSSDGLSKPSPQSNSRGSFRPSNRPVELQASSHPRTWFTFPPPYRP